MSTNSKHNTPYSASDIDKYRKGELSAREMHNLEQAALDDPFLADAIDGLMQHSNGQNLQDDLNDLHARLNKKVTDNARRGRIIRVRRRIALAAALILLLGIGYTFFIRNNNKVQLFSSPATVANNSSTTAARNSPASASQPPVEYKAAADSIQIATDSIQNAYAQTQTSKQHLPAATHRGTNHPQYPSASSPSALPAPSPAALNEYLNAHRSDSVLDMDSTLSALAKRQTMTKALTVKSKPFNAEASRSFNRAATRPFNGAAATPPNADYFTTPSLVFTGKVLDLQNHPLSGAFLAFNGNAGYGTTTDDQGYFKISMHPRDSTQQLTVSMIGYDHTTFAVNALSTAEANDNVIRLRPSAANLDEVVVSGYGNRRKETEVAAPSDDSGEKLDTGWTGAAPVIGRQAYLQYLTVAKKKLGLDPTITGTETISFHVTRNGSLSDFKIEQSLSPAHDAGILRLVTDGPSWQLIRGRKVRAAVTVNF